MINGQSLYWQVFDNQEQGNQSLDALIQDDQLEKLLDVKTISFEVRSENQTVIDYLSKPATIKRLLALMFAPTKEPSTERAIEIFSCAEALRNVLQAILSTRELIQVPFDVLINCTDLVRLQPTTACEPHIYQAFQKLMSSILASPKRVQQLLTYMQANQDCLRAWTAHLMNPQITEVFKTLLLDYKSRTDDITKQVSGLMNKSGVLDRLIGLVTDSSIPLECLSNVCGVLTQLVSTHVPYIQDSVVFQFTAALKYYMTEKLTGPSHLRLTYVGDFCICCMSYMMQHCLQLYIDNGNRIQKLPYDTIQRRNGFEFTDRCNPRDIPPLDIPEIDQYEKQAFPVFRTALELLQENMMPRYEYLRGQANSMFGYGTFSLMRLVARVFAISADLKYVVHKSKPRGGPDAIDWMNDGPNVEDGPGAGMQIVQQENSYGQLQQFAHAGCGGPSDVELSQTFVVQGVELKISVPTIVRAILKTPIVKTLTGQLQQFPENSNLHFVASRIFIPMVEFGDSEKGISSYLFEHTELMRGITSSAEGFVPFKSRTSLLSFYVTFARAFLRICLRMADETQVEEKQKFVAGKGDSERQQQSPQNYAAMIRQSQGTTRRNEQLCAYLAGCTPFQAFSESFLQREDEVPRTFGDARLTAEYAAAKKQTRKRTQGVFDAGFGGFGNFGQQGGGDFFGFGSGNSGWGDFSGSGGGDADKKDDAFGFGWGAF